MIRTIHIVLNKRDGSTIDADKFFLKEEYEIFNYRTELQKTIKGISKPFLVCYFCGQIVKINGGGKTKKVLHFAHIRDSDFCHLKTDRKITKLEINRVKYNGAKESPLHLLTKKLIAEFIKSNSYFSNIKVEKVVKSNTNYLEWKKPDISATYKSFNVVFEIQLSTTFLSVIVDREYFYKENQTYILWVFKNFEIDEFKQRFTEKDVFYSNNRNAFVLDDEAISLSNKNSTLFLLCYYQKPIIKDLEIHYDWELKYVSFNELFFDEANYKIFYFDVTNEESRLKNEISATKNKINQKEYKKQHLYDDYIDYSVMEDEFNDEIEEPEISTVEKLRREKNLIFEENNKDILVGLRNEFLITNFQRLFLNQQSEIYNQIYDFFKVKYNFTKTDLNFINRTFKTKTKSTKKLNDVTITYYLSISIFLSKLTNHKDLYTDYDNKIQNLLFAILSIKTKRVIGNNFTNLIQVVNQHTNIRSNKSVSFDIIVKAIEVYYGIEEFCMVEDKKGLLKGKIQNINNWKPKQETKYNYIINIVFPEMKF